MTDAEITAIADECGMYECHDNGRINGNTLLDFARAILAAQLAAPVAAQEPHAWECLDMTLPDRDPLVTFDKDLATSLASQIHSADGKPVWRVLPLSYTPVASQPAQGERQPLQADICDACPAPYTCMHKCRCKLNDVPMRNLLLREKTLDDDA